MQKMLKLKVLWVGISGGIDSALTSHCIIENLRCTVEMPIHQAESHC